MAKCQRAKHLNREKMETSIKNSNQQEKIAIFEISSNILYICPFMFCSLETLKEFGLLEMMKNENKTDCFQTRSH